ncbi:hypothetical protein Csa_006149 [Cucumis sativus]|uniref:Uncharacterized protein n=1 Tax=Cucumis sativus TaxID=3659 RepID=A0A0A0LKW5_CUCSA|nr:hypothetical protein Csa_006149 [Cucumis sativus]
MVIRNFSMGLISERVSIGSKLQSKMENLEASSLLLLYNWKYMFVRPYLFLIHKSGSVSW